MVENVAPMPRPMRVIAGASSAALAAVPESATMAASTATPPTVTTMPARLSRRPSLVSRFLQATDAMTIPTAAGAKPGHRGPLRAVADPPLQEQRDRVEQPGHGGEEDQAEDEPGGEAPVAQQRRLDQRRRRGPLALGEGGEEDHPGGHDGDRRGSPPVGGPLDQAEQQAEHTRREQRRAQDVDAHRAVADVARQ